MHVPTSRDTETLFAAVKIAKTRRFALEMLCTIPLYNIDALSILCNTYGAYSECYNVHITIATYAQYLLNFVPFNCVTI